MNAECVCSDCNAPADTVTPEGWMCRRCSAQLARQLRYSEVGQ